MNTLEMLRETMIKFPDMNAYERALMIKQIYRAAPKILAAVAAADTLAIHISGILELKAVGTPETTKGWLDGYLKARAELEVKS